MTDTVNIGQSPDAEQTVQIGPSTPPVDVDTARLRAEKAQFGLGSYMPQTNKDAWYSSILSGQEPEMRQAAAAAVSQKDTQDRLQTLQQSNYLPPPKKADPDSIIEQEYGNKFMSPMRDMNNEFYRTSLYGQANIQDASAIDSAANTAAKIAEGAQIVGIHGTGFANPAVAAQWAADQLKQGNYGRFILGGVATMASGMIAAPFELMEHIHDAMEGKPYSTEQAVQDALLIEMGRNPEGVVPYQRAAVIKAATDAVKASVSVDGARPTEAVQASVHGDLETAATVQTAANMDAPKTPETEVQRDVQSLMSVFKLDMDKIRANPGNFEVYGGFTGQDLVNRISAANERFVDELSKKVETVQKVNRTPRAIAQADVIREETDRLRGNFRGWGNALINTEFDPQADFNPLTNTYTTRSYIGTYDGTLFKDRETAELQAPLMGVHLKTDPSDVGATVVNKGSGWAIQLRTPFYENSEALLGNSETGLASTKDSRTPRSWLSSLSKGWAASPPMSMSRTEMQNRRIVAHTPSVIKEVATGDWEIVNSVSKQNWAKFNQLLEYGRDLYDPEGNKGYFFESPGEIEDWHTLLFPNSEPLSGNLVEGYFAYKRLYNMDLALRNISSYQFAARMGMEQHQFTLKDSNSGKNIQSDWVKARRMNTLPAGNDPVLVLGREKGVDDDLVSAKKLGTTKRGQQISEDIQTGKANVFEVWDPSVEDFSPVSYKARDQHPRYVISYATHETKPLDVGQMVPRRGGGHFDYKWEGATVQPKIKYDKITDTWKYDGDRIVAMHDGPGEGKDFANRMNTVRKYMVEGMHDEGQASAKRMLAMGPEVFNKWFKEMRTPEGGRVPPYLNFEHPIVYVTRGESSIKHPVIAKMIDDQYGKKFRDGTTSGSAAAQFKVQYTGERDAEDLFTARNKGTWNNPLWEYEPTKMVNALPTLGRAISRIANSQASDPMKIASITHWLKEAYPLMDRRTQREVWSAPWRIFNSNEIKWNSTAENLPMIRIMEGNRRKIKSFSGAFNPEERFMYSVTAKASEKLYENRKGIIKADVVPTWMLPHMSNPWTVMRSVAVHPILGLFKISALPMQLTTFVNVLGIAGPRHAGAGFTAALMHEVTRLNAHPNTIKLFDKFAQGFGWRRGEFTEAYELMHTTGFWNVAGEHGIADNPDKYNPIKSVGQAVLNAGMKPFQEGAQFVRAASWYTAYHEYRRGGGGLEGFPGKTGAVTREDVSKILNRAGLLDHNMSRAATADYQKGPGSIPFNFWAYKLRLTEMMLGFGESRQLTRAEKVSLFATSTIMFGPLSGPLGLYGVGIEDWARRNLMSGEWNVPFTNLNIGHTPKYITGENWWLSAFIEGVPPALLAWYTSEPESKDPKKRRGNWYDIGPHFGNQSLVDDIAKERSVMDIVAGAPGSKFAEFYSKASPLSHDIWDLLVNHNKGTTMTDLNEAARTINAYNSAYTVVTAAGTHVEMTKNNKIMQSDVSTKNAAFMAILGVHDQQSIDAFDRNRIMRHQEEARNLAEKLATQEFHWWMDAMRNQDPDGAAAHRTKMDSLLTVVQYPVEDPKKMAAFIERGIKSYEEDLPSSINKKFFDLKRYPTGGLVPEQIVQDHQRAIEQGLIEPDKKDTGNVIKPRRHRR